MSERKTGDANPQHSEAYLIEKEKQKTRRSRNMYVFFGIIILAALLALYFMLGQGGEGGIDVSLKEGTFKFNVDKPVVEQAKIETKTYETPDGKSIDYTTGTVNKQVLTDFTNENVSFSPNYFVGENLINENAGYIISSAYPTMWNVQYNLVGMTDPMTPIHTLMATDGSHVNVTMEAIYMNSLVEYVQSSIDNLLYYGYIIEYPNVSYADDGKTAFLTFNNPATSDQSYMKVIQGMQYYYAATANYNLVLSDYQTQQELIWMVANFTLID